jgi:hypothetical protein
VEAARAAEDAADAKKIRLREKKAMQKERSRLRAFCTDIGTPPPPPTTTFGTLVGEARHACFLFLQTLNPYIFLWGGGGGGGGILLNGLIMRFWHK